MGYVDPATLQTPTTGEAPSAAWADTVRANQLLFANRPRWVLELATSPNISNMTFYDLKWTDSDEADTHSFHAVGSSDAVIPEGFGGLYYMRLQIWWWYSNNIGIRYIAIDAAGEHYPVSMVAGVNRQQTFVLTRLNEGDRIKAVLWQNSGDTATTAYNSFSGIWLGH